jgi:hypothetical protein
VDTITARNREVADLQTEMTGLVVRPKEMGDTITGLKLKVMERDATISEHMDTITARDRELADLHTMEAQLAVRLLRANSRLPSLPLRSRVSTTS